MQRSRLVPWLAAIVAAALPAASFAASQSYHTLDVELPDGGTAQIRYVGNVPPSLTMRAPQAAPVVFTPSYAVETPGYGAPAFAAPFAALERMAAMMEQQQALMLREATFLSEAAARDGSGLVEAADAAPGACFTATRVVMVAGQTPKMSSWRSSGCGGDARAVTATGPVRAMGPIADPANRLIDARADAGAEPRLIR